MKLALCVTCIVDQITPEVGVATVRVLRRAGHEVDFPEAQTCCGQPFFNSGFRAQAIRLAKRTIEIFEPHPAVVLPSGSCTTMIRAEYPHLLENEPDWAKRARALAAKTYELSEFLIHRSDWQPESTAGPESAPVTYHDSCHMCRTLGLKEEPRQALQRAGRRIAEMSEPDRCCGFGGIFSVRMPEASNAMTAAKLAEAAGTGATTLVTADPGCLMQMRALAQGTGFHIEHLATLLNKT